MFEAPDGETYFQAGRFIAVLPYVQMAIHNLLVLPPILLLYLVEMNKTASAIVVSVFVVLINTIISLQPSARFLTSLVVLLAFLALLVAFLAQTQITAYVSAL